MEKKVPTIDDGLNLPSLADARIAPDGSQVIYTVTAPDWEENEYVSQIWIVGAEGGKPRQLTFAKQSSQSPRWSPDGQWIAFISKRKEDEHSQIYRMSVLGGEAERLTKNETDVQTIAWSPDGSAIAYLAPEVESDAHKARKEKYGDYHVEDQDAIRTHLWLLILEGKKTQKLAGDDTLHVTDLDWHPDEDKIAFSARPTPDARAGYLGNIYVVDLNTLTVNVLVEEYCFSPRWSPDGNQIVYYEVDAPGFYMPDHLSVISADGGVKQTIHSLSVDLMALLDWGKDGIYFTGIQNCTIHLFCVDPKTGECFQCSPEDVPGWLSMAFTFTEDFSLGATTMQDRDHCGEITLLDLAGGEFRRLTDHNADIADWRLATSEPIQWTSSDGTVIEGVLSKPDDFDPTKQYPLLVIIHGGPRWTSMTARMNLLERRYYPFHQWAAKGALILQPNYRGSAGYGPDFRKLNVRNLGIGDYEDVISGVDALIEKGWVDADRVGAMGWSQGGYISAFITTYSDRFKAVSVGAGIASWYTYYVNTDIHPFTRVYLEATPWEDPDIYATTAPISYINKAQTPTLIQHGEFDRRVPIANAYELYQGLQDMGIEAKLVVYKGMPHGITKPRLNRQVAEENLNWFNRWIWGEEPEGEPAPPCYIAIASSDKAIEVSHWARRDSAHFRVFSGQDGLLAELVTDSGEGYDLKPEAVSTVAAQIAKQIKEAGWSKLVLYTGTVEKEPSALIYLGCLQVAAGIVSEVTVEHKPLADFDADAES